MICEACKEEHDAGTPAARDCEEAQTISLLENKSAWVFGPTDEERDTIKTCYAGAAALMVKGEFPDLQHVSKLMGAEDKGSFNAEFRHDMHPLIAKATLKNADAGLFWDSEKVASILRDAKLPYTAYETEFVTADLRNPAQVTSRAQTVFELCERHNYQIYLVDHAGDNVEWCLRKSRVVGGPT